MRTLLMLVAVLTGVETRAAELQAHFFDVGEGDATLIQFPSGEKVLVDTGNLAGGVVLARKVEAIGTRSLNAVVLTHPHLDHIGGIFVLKDWFSIQRIYDNGELLPPDDDTFRWYRESVRERWQVPALRTGEEIRLGDGVIKVLHPARLERDWNTNSLVLLVEFGALRLLLMGDANAGTERVLQAPPAQILKVGHHGASDASTDSFLEAVAPKMAVISVNAGNVRGYPHDVTIARFNRRGIRVLETRQHGDITVRGSSSGQFTVSCSR